MRRAFPYHWTPLKSRKPSARADEFRRAATRLGFPLRRQTGSHERWVHTDGRAVTIPIQGGRDIGPPLFQRIIEQLGISIEEFRRIRSPFNPRISHRSMDNVVGSVKGHPIPLGTSIRRTSLLLRLGRGSMP